MSRRYSYSRLASELARDARRRERERLKKERDQQREAQRLYLGNRLEEAEEKNRELAVINEKLLGTLQDVLSIENNIQFDGLRNHAKFQEFDPPAQPIEPKRESFIPKENALLRLLFDWSGRRLQKSAQKGEAKYQKSFENYQRLLSEYNERVERLREAYTREKDAFESKIQEHNQEIDQFEKAYGDGEPKAIIAYCSLVLAQSKYPDEFPQEFRIAYVPEPKELVLDYELPTKEIVPNVAEYKYVKTKDRIDEKTRKITEIKDVYQKVVAAVCLRTIHELFDSDQGNHLQVVTFNGFVNTIDPATGNDIRPYLISTRVIKERFEELNLAKVDMKACLRNLGAQLSPQPSELMPVKPVVEFDMVDKRFVENSDILSDLETRPNLMDLNPWEFENFINNLFSVIGFESKLTRSSKDGGVDAIAFDPRPILGGKVVIQAKRYKNVVGVSAVRDLYGTMINEGANKGILVTTSHYGTDAYDFAKDKPIELIDGGGLLYLLNQNGIKAKIIFPED
ncbi:MAG: restriction endonuclease [Anaerolineales bacterium]|nr:restriction endonuclease [Anaerolineales bacterium]